VRRCYLRPSDDVIGVADGAFEVGQRVGFRVRTVLSTARRLCTIGAGVQRGTETGFSVDLRGYVLAQLTLGRVDSLAEPQLLSVDVRRTAQVFAAQLTAVVVVGQPAHRQPRIIIIVTLLAARQTTAEQASIHIFAK